MTNYKNWSSRRICVAKYHIEFLKSMAERKGITSLTDIVNFLIAEYRDGNVQHSNTNEIVQKQSKKTDELYNLDLSSFESLI
jgi:hypothetical protein